MRIFFITNLNSIHAIRWIQPVIDANHEVFVVSYGQNSLPLPGANEVIELTHRTNLRKIRFVIWSRLIRGYIRNFQPDIIHAHQIPAAGWMGALSGFHPFVVTAWGSDILIEPQKSYFRNILTKFVLARTDYLTVPSAVMYKAALNLGFPEENLYLIPWGVETNIFKPDSILRLEGRKRLKIQNKTPVILCPRAINSLYNLDIVVEACHSILSSFPDLRLILLKYNTNSEYLKIIESRISSLKMEANIIWLPRQETVEKMAILYQVSDVVLSIPSSEGYGFTTYEAMASGVPTIITDLPVFEDDLHDQIHVLKVPVRDCNKTARALESVLSKVRLRQSLIENGISKCASISIQNRIDQVESLYKYIQEQM